MLPKAVVWSGTWTVAESMEVARETEKYYFSPRSPAGFEKRCHKAAVIATCESVHEAAARVTRACTHADLCDQKIRELRRKRRAGVEAILKGGDA